MYLLKILLVLSTLCCGFTAAHAEPTGVIPLKGPIVINDICAQPIIFIPRGCLVTDMLIFDDANFFIEIVPRKGMTLVNAPAFPGLLFSDGTMRSTEGGRDVKYKEVNVWYAGTPDKMGTMIGYIKEEMCLFNDDPDNGSYIYRSDEDIVRWVDSDSGNIFGGAFCALNDLPGETVDWLANQIPGLGNALSNCVGSWGTLRPPSGFATHDSDVMHAAHVGYRGLHNSGGAQGVGNDEFQFGYPSIGGCFYAGDPLNPFNPPTWEENVKNKIGLFPDNDSMLIVVWQQEWCCLK